MEHKWTYRNGRSECVHCGETANDLRGLPYGCYAVNGAAMTATRLATEFACPKCLESLRPRTLDGKLRILCNGDPPHDIEKLGRAITREHRDAIVRKQEQAFDTVLAGLPEHLRKEIMRCQ